MHALTIEDPIRLQTILFDLVPMSASLWDESDSENELPAGWEETVGEDGSVVFHNYMTGLKQQEHPISGHCKRLPATLPPGWQRITEANGTLSFIHVPTGHLSPVDPRLAFAVPSGRHTRDRLIARQKFDKFSSGDEILLGKDLRGQFIVVSASGCGLGHRIATKLATAGATVVCASPFCPPGAHPASAELATQADGTLSWIPCDLGDLASVSRFGQIYKSLGLPLHVCVLTADVLPPWYRPAGIGKRSLAKFLRTVWDRFPLTAMLGHCVWRLFHSCVRRLCAYLRRSRGLFRRTRSTPEPACCVVSTCPITQNGFEWCVQHNYLAQVLLLRSLAHCFARTSRLDTNGQETTGRIVLLSEEVHRVNLPLILDWEMVLHQFKRAPTCLSSWFDQYRWTKLFQLLFLLELQRRIAEQYCHMPGVLGRAPILCACAQGSPLVNQCASRLKAIRPLWIVWLLRFVWFIGSIFGQAVEQKDELVVVSSTP